MSVDREDFKTSRSFIKTHDHYENKDCKTKDNGPHLSFLRRNGVRLCLHSSHRLIYEAVCTFEIQVYAIPALDKCRG